MLIVRTSPRDGVSYLEATLARLDDVPRTRIVLSDGPLGRRPAGWEVVELPAGTGSRRSGWTALQLAHDARVPDLLLLEDDLEICLDGGVVMHDAHVPDDCFLASFLTAFPPPGFQPRQPGNPRMLVQEARWYTGAQALKLPRESLETCVGIDPYSLGLPDEPHLFDDALAIVTKGSRKPFFGTVMPNPVRHVGRVSACGGRPGRTFCQGWIVKKDQRFPLDVKSLMVVR